MSTARPVLFPANRVPKHLLRSVRILAERNEWRVLPMYDRDDLEQEAHFVWVRVQKHYRGKRPLSYIQNAFFRSFANRITDIAAVRHVDVSLQAALAGEDEEMLYEPGAPDDALAEADLRMMIEDAPETVKEVLEELALARRHPGRMTYQDDYHETDNEVLCRVVRKSPTRYDYATPFNRWLLGS